MPLFGTLSTMPLEDVLQWLGSTARTGTLKVERDRLAKSVLLRDGRIFACTSNDPPEKIGHFLLSRGRVTEEELRAALNSQESSRKYLGELFVEMGVLTEEELASHLQAQAAETIYGLFDWPEAVFRFSEDLEEQPKAFHVDLDVGEVVAKGLERAEELRQIREVFPDRNVILRKTSVRLPAEALSNTMAQTLYDAIVDDRSLAELLLHVHGSEYLVTKFLFALHSSGVIEVIAAPTTAEPVAYEADSSAGRVVEAVVESTMSIGGGTAVATPVADPPSLRAPNAASSAAATEVAESAEAAGDDEDSELLDIPEVFFETSDVEATEESPGFRMRRSLAIARGQLDEGRFEDALSTLEGVFSKHPDEDSVRKMVAEAEAAFIDKAYRHLVPANKIPVLARSIESLAAENLSPAEFFLISRIDGTWDVKSIVQIAPLREVDVLVTLKRLRENGVVDLKDPAV